MATNRHESAVFAQHTCKHSSCVRYIVGLHHWHDLASKVVVEGRCGRDLYCCLDAGVECGLIELVTPSAPNIDVRMAVRSAVLIPILALRWSSILRWICLLQLIDDEFGKAVCTACFIASSSSVPKMV